VNRFLVTGVSGAGKSTVARQLCAWGHHARSADADTALCGWYDGQGRRVTRPTHPDAAWLAGHLWRWDASRLDEIIVEAEQAGARSLWLCGQAANAVELAGRFDAVFLLDIDQQTMAARMQRPERGNDFGRVGDSLDAALAGYLPFVAGWRRFGARSVDATRDVATVAENLLLTAALAVLPPR
jgi:broad-specificity NMP kinase